ncbi:MAG: ribbon-helix-helix protein, CopG family [Actinomycetes bacterium]
MRTTLTLDDDVAEGLRRLARERNLSFKEAVNSTIRAGLHSERAAKAYRVPARPLGLRPGVDLTKALRLAADLEDDEIVRKLELRK